MWSPLGVLRRVRHSKGRKFGRLSCLLKTAHRIPNAKTVLPFKSLSMWEMAAALRCCDWGLLTKGACLHPGAEHGEPDVLKDELQLYGGNWLSSGFGKIELSKGHEA